MNLIKVLKKRLVGAWVTSDLSPKELLPLVGPESLDVFRDSLPLDLLRERCLPLEELRERRLPLEELRERLPLEELPGFIPELSGYLP